MIKNFAVIGVGGFIAPRHLRAIRDTGHKLLAAVDLNDSVGILDQYSFDVEFFTKVKRFDRYLEKLQLGPEESRVHYVSICSPNYLHDAHCRLALRMGADVICEKPLVINPRSLDALEEIEHETGRSINTVLQLRFHPELMKLQKELRMSKGVHHVELTYVSSRGSWYQASWKGNQEKSGGISTNIGIHLFDLLIWLFGSAGFVKVYYADEKRVSGFIELEHARVSWFLSVDKNDLPAHIKSSEKLTYRSIVVDGKEIEFSNGFADLHTKVYQEVLGGRGFGIQVARPSVDLTHKIRTADISPKDQLMHPYLRGNK